RHRRQEVGIARFEKMGDQPWLLGFELELHPRRQESEAFEQALDVRVRDLHAVEAEARRDLRKVTGELGADFAQVGQFVAVEAQESRVHLSWAGYDIRHPNASARAGSRSNRCQEESLRENL